MMDVLVMDALMIGTLLVRLWTAETFSRMVHRPDRGNRKKEPVSGMV